MIDNIVLFPGQVLCKTGFNFDSVHPMSRMDDSRPNNRPNRDDRPAFEGWSKVLRLYKYPDDQPEKNNLSHEIYRNRHELIQEGDFIYTKLPYSAQLIREGDDIYLIALSSEIEMVFRPTENS